MAIQDINKQEVAQVSGGILGSVTGLLKPVTDVLTGLPVVGGLLGGVLSLVTGLLGGLGIK